MREEFGTVDTGLNVGTSIVSNWLKGKEKLLKLFAKAGSRQPFVKL